MRFQQVVPAAPDRLGGLACAKLIHDSVHVWALRPIIVARRRVEQQGKINEIVRLGECDLLDVRNVLSFSGLPAASMDGDLAERNRIKPKTPKVIRDRYQLPETRHLEEDLDSPQRSAPDPSVGDLDAIAVPTTVPVAPLTSPAGVRKLEMSMTGQPPTRCSTLRSWPNMSHACLAAAAVLSLDATRRMCRCLPFAKRAAMNPLRSPAPAFSAKRCVTPSNLARSFGDNLHASAARS